MNPYGCYNTPRALKPAHTGIQRYRVLSGFPLKGTIPDRASLVRNDREGG
jgi:hypothetical protein